MDLWHLKILDTPHEIEQVEDLQARIWIGNERDIVPAHLLLASIRNGGLLIGAFAAGDDQGDEDVDTIKTDTILDGLEKETRELLVGFVFGFPAIDLSAPKAKRYFYSHMLGVDPIFSDRGIGFLLKRAQWQMVRRMGVDRITWTYDPLQSRNAHLNIARLGAVCSTYRRDYYGQMRDQLNFGVASDRFLVDWWINSRRVSSRLSKKPRIKLDLAHFLAGEVEILNPSHILAFTGEDKDAATFLTYPGEFQSIPPDYSSSHPPALTLVEIPSDYPVLRLAAPELAISWRFHTRAIFEQLFERGYLVTDFIHLAAPRPREGFPGDVSSGLEEQVSRTAARSFYVLSYGESTL